jgi:hypothetical protein
MDIHQQGNVCHLRLDVGVLQQRIPGRMHLVRLVYISLQRCIRCQQLCSAAFLHLDITLALALTLFAFRRLPLILVIIIVVS